MYVLRAHISKTLNPICTHTHTHIYIYIYKKDVGLGSRNFCLEDVIKLFMKVSRKAGFVRIKNEKKSSCVEIFWRNGQSRSW